MFPRAFRFHIQWRLIKGSVICVNSRISFILVKLIIVWFWGPRKMWRIIFSGEITNRNDLAKTIKLFSSFNRKHWINHKKIHSINFNVSKTLLFSNLKSNCMTDKCLCKILCVCKILYLILFKKKTVVISNERKQNSRWNFYAFATLFSIGNIVVKSIKWIQTTHTLVEVNGGVRPLKCMIVTHVHLRSVMIYFIPFRDRILKQ